jgi:hypothetical protein
VTRLAARATRCSSRLLAAQNIETLNEVGVTKIVVTCAHCFNTIKNEYPSSAASTRSSTTPSCSTAWSATRSSCLSPARPSPRDVVQQERGLHRGDGDLPRPVLPRVGTTTSMPRRASSSVPCPASSSRRWSAQGEVLLLRRRRRPDVDGGEARDADQHEPHRGGSRDGRRADRHRLPVLSRHDLRRAHGQAGRRCRRGGRGRRCRADAARRREAQRADPWDDQPAAPATTPTETPAPEVATTTEADPWDDQPPPPAPATSERGRPLGRPTSRTRHHPHRNPRT